ncbi:glutamine-rich protein 2 isoform X2 [Meleagris gallopavo]|uniref:glutamine-rich protein 2 isoform X2 n=1 Tax=Meleagris gallopavo TaxID=9103 RepID=UPI00093A28AB|nr:glutamine-rich protein 2 isoform X2 [Meleagris gallopavo]
MASLSLSELLDAAIGTPEVGAVNFTALHSLLRAMLQHLGMQHLPAAGRAAAPGEHPEQRGTASSSAAPDVLKEEGEGKDSDDFRGSEAVPLSQDLLEELGGMKAAQSQMGEDLRMIKGMLGLEDGQDTTAQQWGRRDGVGTDSDVGRPRKHLEPVLGADRDRLSSTESSESDDGTQQEDGLRRPAGGPGTQSVPMAGRETAGTQPDSLGAQAGMRRASQTPEKWAGTALDQAGTSGATATTPGTQPGSPGTQVTTPGMQPGSPGAQITTPGTQPGSPGTQITTPGTQPPGTQITTPGTQPPGTLGTQPAPLWSQGGAAGAQPAPPSTAPHTQTVPSEATPGAMGTGVDDVRSKGRDEALQLLSPTALGAETSPGIDTSSASPARGLAVPEVSGHDVGTAEALKQLSHLCSALEERVAQLEATKSDRTELEELRLPFLEGGQESIASVLTDLRHRVSALQGMASDLHGEKEKIKQLQDAFGKLGVMGADGKVDGSLQLGSVLQEMRRELKELKEKQDAAKATLEQLVADTANRLQEQLDELRSVLGSTTPATQPPSSAEQDEAPCPVCSTDVGAQLGRLLQRYEQLQELVESVSARQAAGKAGRQRVGREQDEELLKHIQAAVTQVQGDCEKLSSVTGNLMDDRHQRQRDIEALFQSLERLEKEKVDKEELVLEIDVKADRAALAGKVSCAQFDAAMEQLNGMIGEMLSKVTGQEQDWHQVQQKLIEELDSKLDRLELAPLRQQLEERWRSILKQLKEKTPRVEADDAAGIRKQLLAHFHCVSCDRPLHMLVPGPHIVTIPPLPPLPSRVTVRPRATFQPEQGHRCRGAAGGSTPSPTHCSAAHDPHTSHPTAPRRHNPTAASPRSTARRSCWARMGTSTRAGWKLSCLPSQGRRAQRGISPSCPPGTGVLRTQTSCPRGPRAPCPHSASQAPPGCWSSAQCHPTAACPTSGRRRAEKKAPQLREEGEPRLKPTHGHRVDPWAAASSNKERWMRGICIVRVGMGLVLPSASLFCLYGHLVLHYLQPPIHSSFYLFIHLTTHPSTHPSPLLAAHAGYGAGPHTPPIGTQCGCRGTQGWDFPIIHTQHPLSRAPKG